MQLNQISIFKFKYPRFKEISIIKESKPDKKVKSEFCNNNDSRLKKYSNLIINVKLKSCYMEGQQRLSAFSNLNSSTPWNFSIEVSQFPDLIGITTQFRLVQNGEWGTRIDLSTT